MAAIGQQCPPWLINNAAIRIVEESGIIPPCSFPPSFVTTATTHCALAMSHPGKHGTTTDLVWSETAMMLPMMLLLTSPEIFAVQTLHLHIPT